MKKKWRRFLSSVLSCTMLLSLMPAGVFAADGENTAEELSSISAGTGELEDYLENQEDGEEEGTYDYVWYGGLKWRVLETEYEADEGTGTLLLSEYVLNYGQAWDGIRTYSSRGGTSDGDTDYGYLCSDIRAYLTGEGDYTSFITARAIADDELDHSSVEFYYYRVEVDDSQLASGAEEGTVYYTYDSEGAVYVEEASADLTSLTFPYGQYFVLNEDGTYTEADAYDAGETYYYDASSYVVADVSEGFDADTEYFTFCKVSGSLDYTEFSPAVFGTRYYAGYSTTGSGIPADDSSSTWTIVSGMSAEDISFATEYGFTQAELEAVLTVSTEADNARSGIFTYYGGALEGDTYFLLSASESGNADYGLETAADRAATFLDGSTEARWWLRTSFYSSSPAIVEETGYLNATFASDDCVGIRPAFVLDPDSVLFLSSAEGGKELASASESVSGFVSLAEEDTSEYILTLEDDSLSVSVADADEEDGVYTFSYSDASTWGDNVYLSAILTDESGETIYGYARLAAIDSEDSTSGTVSFELPGTAIVDGEEVELDAADCILQVFLEVCSTTGATEDSCGTDYASEPTEVSLDGTGAEAQSTPTVSFEYDTVDVNLDGSVENPLTVEPEGLEVTYTSSDESVATVDAEGNVTIVGEGTTVITATTTETEDYASASDSYTLTVSGVAIEYSVSSYVGEYDGEEHTISLKVESPEGAVVTYGTSADDISLTEAPAYSEPGTYTVYYQITADGYETVTGSADIVITEEEQEEESEDVSGCPRDETCPIYPYTDTLRTNWYHDAVHYVIEHGIMIGTSSTTWEPESATTRGMIVTILYRMEGSPEVEGTSSFSDVEEGSWYEDAVIWAESEGIVLGYGNGLYGPGDTLTREQYAVILYRYSQYKGYDIELADLSSFPDADEVSDWAVDGMAWAVSASVISGTVYGNVTELSPTDDCIRAMAAQITYNYIHFFMN